MSSKTIPKADAAGKGRQLRHRRRRAAGDRVQRSARGAGASRRTPTAALRFNAGSIAIHALRVAFIERLNHGGRLKLPWHRAEKKVPYVDDAGNAVKPDKPNAVKLEQFVFDAIPLAKNAIVYKTDRGEEFSPVKNAEGRRFPRHVQARPDPPRRALAEGSGRRGPGKGGEPDAVIEISPLFATTAEQLRERSPKVSIAPGAAVYLDR